MESRALIAETLLASSKSTVWLSANVHTAAKSPCMQMCLNNRRQPSTLGQDRTGPLIHSGTPSPDFKDQEANSQSASPLYAGYVVPEVLRSLGDRLAIKADDYTTKLLIAVSDIEVDLLRHIHQPLIPKHPDR